MTTMHLNDLEAAARTLLNAAHPAFNDPDARIVREAFWSQYAASLTCST